MLVLRQQLVALYVRGNVEKEENLMGKTAAVKAHSQYDVHPGVAMVQKWVGELKEKTGRSLEEWIALVKREGPKDENQDATG